jgi:glycosidase
MQWNDSKSAGFTDGKPWLPVAPSYTTHNVATETADAHSILNFYRKILELRRDEPALRSGQYVPLNPQDPNVFAFARRFKGEAVLVVLNMSGSRQTVKINLKAAGFSRPKLRVLVTSSNPPITKVSTELVMEPFSALIAKTVK